MSQVRQLESVAEPRESGGEEPILRVSNLSVTFSKQSGSFRRKKSLIRAVDNVSFEIYRSEVMTVVGESGSGKTTLAKSILALLYPTSGSIEYNGAKVTSLKKKSLLNYRRDVQLIYQDPYESLIPRLDILATLSIPIRRLAGETQESHILEIASSLLYEVGLDATEYLHKLPYQLSGGERQRVNIARALASNPKLLIADEPVTMLDASQRLTILSLLAHLRLTRNLTLLLITHDLASAKLMSDRVAVMYLGKIVEIGPTDSILSKPHHPYAQLILEATPRLERGKKEVGSYTATIEESANVKTGCSFVPRCKFATHVCGEIEPQLTEKTDRHLAACHNPLNLESH